MFVPSYMLMKASNCLNWLYKTSTNSTRSSVFRTLATDLLIPSWVLVQADTKEETEERLRGLGSEELAGRLVAELLIISIILGKKEFVGEHNNSMDSAGQSE